MPPAEHARIVPAAEVVQGVTAIDFIHAVRFVPLEDADVIDAVDGRLIAGVDVDPTLFIGKMHVATAEVQAQGPCVDVVDDRIIKVSGVHPRTPSRRCKSNPPGLRSGSGDPAGTPLPAPLSPRWGNRERRCRGTVAELRCRARGDGRSVLRPAGCDGSRTNRS